MTSVMSDVDVPASRRALRTGSMVRWTRSSTRASNLARVTVTLRCFGPVASAVMYGRLISVS